MNEIYKYCIHGMITIVMILIAMIIMQYHSAPQIVKLDLLRITSHYAEWMSKDSVQAKQISETIKTNLDVLIDDYSTKHNVVIVQDQAIVGNKVADITPYIINQLDSKVNANK